MSPRGVQSALADLFRAPTDLFRALLELSSLGASHDTPGALSAHVQNPLNTLSKQFPDTPQHAFETLSSHYNNTILKGFPKYALQEEALLEGS